MARAVTVITKSGTNQFRGSAFEFFNSDKLNANSFYFGRDRKPDKLPLEANTFGGTFGGPIARNKLFFFGSFEGYKRTSSLHDVLQRAGRSAPQRRLQQSDE